MAEEEDAVGGAPAREVIFAAVPLTFNRKHALAYTGIASKLFSALERSGSLTGRRIGKNGEVIYLRAQLDMVVHRLFGIDGTDIDDEFRGIGD